MKQCARDADIVARLGGEEFVIALQHADCENTQLVAKRILDKIRHLACGEETSYRITASIGISCQTPGTKVVAKSVEKWLQEADKALYKAKQSGKDRVIIFD